MQKDISTSDVKLFLSVAPPSILSDLKQIIDRRLDSIIDEDARKNAVRAAMMGDQEPDLSGIVSARAELAALATGNSGGPDLKSQLEKQLKIESMVPEEVPNAKVTFIDSDKYGDGLCSINDPELRELLEVSLAKCQREGVYFPFGFGRNKDQLKIKKFASAEKGQSLKLNLKFSKWNQQGKSGFSCYPK